MTCGWIKLPPQRQASSAMRMSATVQGNSPNPASSYGKIRLVTFILFLVRNFSLLKFTVFPASWKSNPPTFRMPQPRGASGRLVTEGGFTGSSLRCESKQHTSNTSWHSFGLNRMSMIPNPSSWPSVRTVFVLGSHKKYGTQVHLSPWLVVITCGAVVGWTGEEKRRDNRGLINKHADSSC